MSVEFKNGPGEGLRVVSGDHVFGVIDKQHGFFVGPIFTHPHIDLSADDLRQIAEKVEEVQAA